MQKIAIHLAALLMMLGGQISWAQTSAQGESMLNDQAAPMSSMEQPDAYHPPGHPGHPGHPGWPPPPPHNHWEFITCGSPSPLETRTCRVDGRILQVSLMAQRSIFPCRANQTWGAYSNKIWTAFGCVGTFRVRVRR